MSISKYTQPVCMLFIHETVLIEATRSPHILLSVHLTILRFICIVLCASEGKKAVENLSIKRQELTLSHTHAHILEQKTCPGSRVVESICAVLCIAHYTTAHAQNTWINNQAESLCSANDLSVVSFRRHCNRNCYCDCGSATSIEISMLAVSFLFGASICLPLLFYGPYISLRSIY